MPTDQESDLAAVGIYAVMARDIEDAIDMVNECTDVRTLETLHTMLTTKGRPNTDQELNDLFAGPTKRRLEEVKGTRMTLADALKRAKSVPKVGDYEFCRKIGGDGMFHMFMVVHVGDDEGEVTYMVRCGDVPRQEMGDLAKFEVARADESCTCLPCML